MPSLGQNPPKKVSIRGTRCEFVGIARATKDALYTGIDSKGQEVHAIVTNRFAHEHQAAYIARGS